MGFWSKLGGALKSIGKVALKAAPIATAFIPGVGLPLSMAIGAGAGIGSSKLGGASWKNSLLGGALGAGTSALGGSGFLGKLGSKLGIGGKTFSGMDELVQQGSYGIPSMLAKDSPSLLSKILSGINTGTQLSGALGGLRGNNGNGVSGIGSSRLGSYNNPNLMNPLLAGRLAAMNGTVPNGWPPIQQNTNRTIPNIPSVRPRPINAPTTGIAIPRYPGAPHNPMIMDL